MKYIYRLKILLLFLGFASSSVLYAQQDSTISKALKSTRLENKAPDLRPKYNSFPLLNSYLLRQRAEKGELTAQHELGLRFLLGKGFEADTAKALYWIKKAARKNLTTARFNYGVLLKNGIGVEWNPFEAYGHFQFAAEAGMPQAQYVYGLVYADNLIVNKNLQKAYKWVNRAAEQEFEPAAEALERLKKQGVEYEGDDDAGEPSDKEQYQYSLMEPDTRLDYYQFNTDTSEKAREKTLKKLLNSNKSKLTERLGVQDTTLQDTSSLSIINSAAESGSPEALYFLGKMNQRGLLTKRNDIQALNNFLKSIRLGYHSAADAVMEFAKDSTIFKSLKAEIEKDNPVALYSWAALTGLGLDYRITNKQALEFLQRAVEQNYIPALIEMGLNYYAGTLVEQNKEKAVEYWQRAAELESTEAKVRIALHYLRNSTGNSKENIEILRTAARNGSVLGQSALAYCYENGIGLEQDKGTAENYYRLAASRGNRAAYESLKHMYDEIRPDEERFQIYN